MASFCSPSVARCSENPRSAHAKGANTSHRKTPRAPNVAEAAAPAKKQARNTPRYRPSETRAKRCAPHCLLPTVCTPPQRIASSYLEITMRSGANARSVWRAARVSDVGEQPGGA